MNSRTVRPGCPRSSSRAMWAAIYRPKRSASYQCALVGSRGKPLSIKTLERAFATEIKTAKTEVDFKVGQFIIDSILGRTPVNAKPRKDDRERARWAIFYAKTRMGWKVTA